MKGEWVEGRALAVPEEAPAEALDRLRSGRYESVTRIAADSALRDTDVVLEAGGGLGWVARHLARRVERVASVEADPRFYAALAANTAGLTNVVALYGALTVGDERQRQFFRSTDYRGSSLEGRPDWERLAVPAVDVDRVVVWLGVTALLLDIEGHETELLLRMDLRPIRAVVVEWHPTRISEVEIVRSRSRLLADGMELVGQWPEETPTEAWARP